jgi:hypothetical protein
VAKSAGGTKKPALRDAQSHLAVRLQQCVFTSRRNLWLFSALCLCLCNGPSTVRHSMQQGDMNQTIKDSTFNAPHSKIGQFNGLGKLNLRNQNSSNDSDYEQTVKPSLSHTNAQNLSRSLTKTLSGPSMLAASSKMFISNIAWRRKDTRSCWKEDQAQAKPPRCTISNEPLRTIGNPS